MKRSPNTSDHAQKKASKASDRSAGRAGIHDSQAKAAQDRQHGDSHQHQIDAAHLKENKKIPSEK